MTSELRDGPLTGVTVIDLTVAIQGPHAASYLADMGAEVIKVERPGGELNRYVRGPGFPPSPEVMGSQYVAMNRGKRGIVVDVHSALGQEVMSRLIARADVLVTNYRREALERMGLGYAEVAAQNPRLVYGRVSGFGPQGPAGGKAMLDGAAQARGGLAAISGPANGPPMPPGAAVADHAGSMQLALGIMTALYARERTGRGQEVDTSVARRADVDPGLGDHPLQHERRGAAPRRAAQPEPALPVRDLHHQGRRRLPARRGDERRVVGRVLAVRRPTGGARRPALEHRGQADRRPRLRGRRGGDPRRRARHVREPDDGRVDGVPGRAAGDHPRAGPGLRRAARRPAGRRERLPRRRRRARYGTARVVSNVVKLSDTPGRATVHRPPPRLGEHTAEVMAELGFGPEDVEQVLRAADGFAEQTIAAVFDD